MILLIDHEDSFVHNLAGALAMLGEETGIMAAREVTVEAVRQFDPTAIVLSSGAGSTSDWPLSVEAVREFGADVPVLGISLGQLIIAEAYGGERGRMQSIRHGKTAAIRHDRDGLFAYIPQPFRAMCCHSEVLGRQSLPDALCADAFSMEDDAVMAVHHTDHPVYGLQFHPESVGTEGGERLLAAFLAEAGQFRKRAAAAGQSPQPTDGE
ncbi:anthranilate synthase component II [Edaphobacillus lindanitolerans]|uniref:Anthranilate synthase, component II n=1 Tax=Edaphobacillus lindanitolerans TaxID=550447 RepID=A0A1U7PRE6_9BACI|nr:aminodeoxychorismate/anthranilate synthase component II [Edaphobacillus lindanitolerans]SIT87173.1 anthranilate synthase, component II [Edaphobacillus lindanitolerans]